MDGRLTGIVLGAGASYCYSAAPGGIPTQKDLVGRLFFGADATGEGFPDFSDTHGLRHSFLLAQYLRSKFQIPEESGTHLSKMDYWSQLQMRGFDLESLYAEIEKDPASPSLLDDFQSIVRTAVLAPTGERQKESVCSYHRMLCERLEPGDYIVDFNWDSVMADALLYFSHFWFPSTGFGIPVRGTLLPASQKAHRVASLVTLFHIHGSAILFEPADRDPARSGGVLYVGPKQWSTATGLLAIMGRDPADPEGTSPGRNFTQEEEERAGKGWIILDDKWFRPVFVPPSRHKAQVDNWYCAEVRRRIHSVLPYTERLVFAGYSFPDADSAHLREIFVDRILNRELEIQVVNRDNENGDFRRRVESVLPAGRPTYPLADFREFCQVAA